MVQQIPQYGLKIFLSTFTWLAVTIYMPSNTPPPPLKLKGPAWHLLNSLPENSIGSWEDMEDAFRDNFQGTYIRPPDADDLSHIVQQPGESARKLWTRFLIKENQIIDCLDTEALAAFKHSIRDEWLT